ncbi:MAG: hypothetical protein M3Y64_02730, partial [Gemmatimonadota bacterium]|nr:hypothetical protein [Gemmatimonadota bacterium]
VDATAGGAGGLEDGFDFLTDVAFATLGNSELMFQPEPAVPEISAHYSIPPGATWWRATAPLPPGHGSGPLHWLRTAGKQGAIAGVWGWKPFTCDWNVSKNSLVSVTTFEGTTALHGRTPLGWHIALSAGAATSSIELGGVCSTELQLPAPVHDAAQPSGHVGHPATAVRPLPKIAKPDSAMLEAAGSPMSGALRIKLGEANYSRTEQSWQEAGEPEAIVQLAVTSTSLVLDVLARTGALVVPEVGEENLLDNERRDVNSDGLQFHLAPAAGDAWTAAWLAVPAHELQPLARVTATTPAAPALQTMWRPVSDGWAMRCLIALRDIERSPDGSFVLEVIVNERSPDRQRRRGQLVLSGGGGFGYLRGDRADSGDAFTFTLPPLSPTTA